MKFEIKSNYDQQLKDLIKAFNSGLITFDEMCELNMNVIDKANIDKLRNKQSKQKFVYFSIIKIRKEIKIKKEKL